MYEGPRKVIPGVNESSARDHVLLRSRAFSPSSQPAVRTLLVTALLFLIVSFHSDSFVAGSCTIILRDHYVSVH